MGDQEDENRAIEHANQRVEIAKARVEVVNAAKAFTGLENNGRSTERLSFVK